MLEYPADESMDVSIAVPGPLLSTSKTSSKCWSIKETKQWTYTLFIGTTLLYASRVALPMSMTLVSSEYKWSKTDSGVVLSCFFWGYAVVQGIAGYLADIYGGENILAGAALLWSLLTLLTPFLFDLANKTPFAITIVVFVRVALGICQGFHFPTIASLVSRNLLSVDKARVFGLILAASHVGNVVCGSFGSVLLDKFGWEVLFQVIGVLGVIWWIYFCHICRSLSLFRQRAISRDKSAADIKLKMLFGDQLDDDSQQSPRKRAHSATQQNSTVPWMDLFKKLPFWAACCAHFCGANAYFTLFSWLPSYFVENFPEAQGWVFNFIPNLAITITSLLAPWIAANLITKGYTVTTVRKLMEGISQVGMAVCLFRVSALYGYVSALFFLSAAMALRGFHHGGVSVNPNDFAPNHTGAVFGLMNMASAVPGFVGVYAAGYILETYHSWSYVFSCTGFVCLIGVAIYTAFGTGKQII